MGINEIKLPAKIEKNKKLILIISIFLVIFIAMFYFLIQPPDDNANIKKSGNIKPLPHIDNEKAMLKSYKFERLESFIKKQMSVEAAELGRQNPFTNY